MKIHSRLMAVFLSLAIALSFIPTLAFADDAPANNDFADSILEEDQFETDNLTIDEIEDLTSDQSEDIAVDSLEELLIDGYDEETFDNCLSKLKDFLKNNPDASDYDVIKAAYIETLSVFSPAPEQGGSPAEFLSDLLYECEIDSAYVSGTDSDGNAVDWVLARPFDSEYYYVLYPASDLGKSEDEFDTFLLGSNALTGYTADEEFSNDSFIQDHPVSEEEYNPASLIDNEADDESAAGNEDAEAVLSKDVKENEAEDASETASDAAAVKDAKEESTRYGATEYVYASGSCGQNATWKVTYTKWPELTLRIGGSGAIDNYSVADPGWYKKSFTGYINRIIIGKNITRIGEYAFYDMPSVKSVKFAGKKVSSIGSGAFAYMNGLESISIPSGVKTIEYAAFYGSQNLKKVGLPSSLKTVGSYAFYNLYSLKSICIPSGVEHLGDYSLSNIGTVYYAGTSSKWNSINGPNAAINSKVVFAKKLTGVRITLKKSSYVFTSKAIKPSPVVKIKVGGKWKTLKKGVDYTLSYKKNTNVGKATVVVSGTNNYYGTFSKSFRITKRSLSKAKVSGIKNRVYTGRARGVSPVVKVKIGKKYVKLKKGRDYTVKYRNNKKVSRGKTRAVITITGKGNYKGKLSRKFKILKASPKVYFSKKSVSRKSSQGSFTQKPKKKIKGKLSYTFSSSKPSVATVNKRTGRVTPKRVGTTIISVRTKATKNYRATTATYKLTLRPLRYKELPFKFYNYSKKRIPLSTFKLFYNPTQAATLYRKNSDIGDGGVCFGMATASSMLRTAGSGMTPANFKRGAKNPSQLSMGNRFRSKGPTLKTMIEAMHTTQLSAECQRVERKNKNRIAALVTSVKSGYPTIIGMDSLWSKTGHAIVGYKYKRISSREERIYVYDSSYIGDNSYITLYKSGGRYTDWYYSYDYGFMGPANITFISGKTYRSIWKNRKAASRLGQMYISSNSFKILGPDGKVVAEMKDGEFSSKNDDIFLAQTFDFESDSNLVMLPADKYTVQDTSGSDEKLTVTSLDENQSIEVTTSASAVVVETVDDAGVNKATVRPAEGESFEVSILDGTGGGEPEELVFTGEGTGKAITLGTEDGDCIVKNAGDLQLELNGVEKDFTVSGGVAEIQ